MYGHSYYNSTQYLQVYHTYVSGIHDTYTLIKAAGYRITDITISLQQFAWNNIIQLIHKMIKCSLVIFLLEDLEMIIGIGAT